MLMNINKKLLRSVAMGVSLFAGMTGVNVANAGGFFDDILQDAKAEVQETLKDAIGGSIRRAREMGQYEREAEAAAAKQRTDMRINAETREFGKRTGYICQSDIRGNTYGGSGQAARTTNSSSSQCSDSVYAQEEAYNVQYEGQLKRQLTGAIVNKKINDMYYQNARDISNPYNNASSYHYNGNGVSYYGRQSNYEKYQQQQQVNPTYRAPSGPAGASRY